MYLTQSGQLLNASMNFDSTESELYARLTIVSRGLRDLSGNSKQRRQARHKVADNAGYRKEEVEPKKEDNAPAAVYEATKLLDYWKVPNFLKKPITVLVALALLWVLLHEAWNPASSVLLPLYDHLPVIVDLHKLDRELNDPKTGLSAIANNVSASQKQLSNVTSFLVGKFPEFNSLILKEAEKASLDRNNVLAADLLNSTATAWEAAAAQRVVEPVGFFSSAIDTLNRIETDNTKLGQDVHIVRLALADYRSSLQSAPAPPTGPPTRSPTLISNMTFRLSAHGSLVINLEPNQIVEIRNVRVINGHQDLAGFKWTDVTFIGTHITYRGGPADLANVHFVNCTFDLPYIPQAKKILDYAALAQSNLTVS